jgi:CarboxypepD_reg-like domain
MLNVMDNVQQRVLTMSNIFTPFLNTSFRKGLSIFSHKEMWPKWVFLQVFIIICLAVGLGRSQSIKGTVSDEKTGDRLPSATVFFNNTSVVAETDADGNYWLKNLPTGNFQFIVRMMGYKTFTRQISIEKTTNFVFDIKLSAEEKVLEEIKITTKRDKSWEKQFKVFEKQFLGNFAPENASKIINPWVLDFTFEKGILIAKAQDVLEIYNPSLGYQIRYSLNTFRFDGSQVFFNGNAEFSNLFSNDIRQKSQWKLKRLEAYRGSDIHFFKVLNSL